MHSSDDTVLLEHSCQRIRKIRERRPERYEKNKAENTGSDFRASALPENGNRKEIPHQRA